MSRVVRRAELLGEARQWIDTPVLWQQCRKGVGVDCKFLMKGVAECLGLDEAASLAAKTRTYRRNFSGRDLVAGLDATLIRTATPGPGDVVAIRLKFSDPWPRHVAMLSDKAGWVIHAYGLGFDRVAEVPLGGERMIWGYWTWPSLAPEERVER